MSTLRRRIFGTGTNSNDQSRTPSPVPSIDSKRPPLEGSSDGNEKSIVSVSRKKLERLNSYVLEKDKKPKGLKRRNAWIFGLGGLFGIILAAFFAGNSEVIDFAHLKDMNLEGLFDVLPAGLVKDAQALQVSHTLGGDTPNAEYLETSSADAALSTSYRNTSAMLLHTTRSLSVWRPSRKECGPIIQL